MFTTTRATHNYSIRFEGFFLNHWAEASIMYFLVYFVKRVRYFCSVNRDLGGDKMSAVKSKLDEHITKLESEGLFSGAVLVASKGELLLRQGYGMANYEHDVPNTPETVFRIGSITKQFTAFCILQLVDKGIIQLHDSVGKFIPEFPNGNIITIHHLLSHSSGILNPPSANDVRDSSRAKHSVDDLIDMFKDAPLAFAPGKGFKYSNSGYILLGKIIEVVGGGTYEEYLVDNVFRKIGMNQSGYDHSEQVLKNRAVGYVQFEGSLINSHYIDMSRPYAAGGLYSTVDDLYIWDKSLYSDNLLSEKTMTSMFTPYVGPYGYGWWIPEQERRAVWHGGIISGFTGMIIRYIDDNLTCIVLSNIDHSIARELGWELADLVFKT